MSLKPQEKKLSPIQALSLGAGVVFIIVLAMFGFMRTHESPSITPENNQASLSIVAESPFTQVKTTSEFLGVVTAFVNIVEPNPEGYPPLFMAGFGMGFPHSLQAFLAEAKNYPVPRIMRAQLNTSEAYRTYSQATDYYKAHHKPKDSPITQAEIDDFNKSMEKALDKLPTITGYMALSTVDAYRELVAGSPKHIGSYAKSPRLLPSQEALETMPVFKDLREKFETAPKEAFLIGESLSSALGALAALVGYDSDQHTDAQYEMAYEFVNQVTKHHPEIVGSLPLSQALFTRSYEHAVSYLNRLKEQQGVKLRDRDKGILIYLVMESLARQDDPTSSLKLATHTLESWSFVDPYFKSRNDKFAMLMDPDYRTSALSMFESRTSEFETYVEELAVENKIRKAKIAVVDRRAELLVEKQRQEVERLKFEAEKEADRIRLGSEAIRKIVKQGTEQ